MNSSLYTGVLGLKNHQTKMDVIGNNIANISTYGFKKGRATFADLLSRTYTAAAAPSENRGGINPLQVGLGMSTTAVTNLMMQGQLESTGRLTDVAVDGNGWFVLSEQSGNTVYTRDGAFGLDEEGNLVNANGLYVQGWTRVEVDNDHNFSVDTQRPVDDINFAIGEKLEAAATTQVGLKCNLDEESRSLIADGVDPKEGYATKNDLLVDLYDNDQVDPEWLGIREGDWIEIKVDVSGPDPTSYPTASMLGKTYTILATDGVDVYGDGTLYRYSGLIDDADLPMENITFTAGPLAGMTQVYQSADQIRGNALGNFTIDPDTGMIYSAVDLTTSTIQYDIDAVAENTVPYQDEKYLYFQVTNDTTIGDLESSIQNALDAIDVNGTINATVTYDNDEAKFTIYNNCVSGSRDVNDIHVEINAVSGSAIRQGFLLRDSTYPMTGTRLGLVTGGLGGAMTREDVANLDYQTSTAYLDYGNVDMSTRLFGQVVRARLETTYAAANHNDGVTLAEWTGYTGTANDLAMIADTAELSVNGTVWRNVEVFTGAANEYHIETAGGVPTVYFNTADGVEPSAGDELVFSYRTDGAPVVELMAGVGNDYTIDSTTGQ
ncbi:MAG TPA: flagellar hook-basal body complex protein, partial [bacterium]|nr:flagellar hook-basal body complex protein [bacterium]